MSSLQTNRPDVPLPAQASVGHSSSIHRLRLNAKWQAITATTCVLGMTFALTSSMASLDPTLPAVATGAFLFIVLWTGNGTWIVHVMLVVLFTTSVPEMPRGLRVGGVFVYFNEFLILGSLIYALWILQKNSDAITRLTKLLSIRLLGLFGMIVLLGVGLAVIRGYPFWDIQYDVKSVVEMVMVILLTAAIVAVDDWKRYLKTITAILIFSAALTVYASATGFVLWGRTETAELYAAGGRVIAGGSDATRYLTQTTPLALAVLAGCVALSLSGRIRAVRMMPVLIPALVITILSFSRNTLLALAGAFIFALIIALSNGDFLRIVLRLALIPVVTTIAIIGVVGLGQAAGVGGWINTQASGYTNRVIAGFDDTNERADTSAGYREQENDYIRKAAAKHRIFGGGFGTHYKPPTGQRGTFPAFEGTMYSHNAYNWLYLKIGIVGVATFVALLAACAFPALFRKQQSSLLVTAAATLVGLGFAIWVTPMPIEQPGSALLGIVMGLCIGANSSSVRVRNPSQFRVAEPVMRSA